MTLVINVKKESEAMAALKKLEATNAIEIVQQAEPLPALRSDQYWGKLSKGTAEKILKEIEEDRQAWD